MRPPLQKCLETLSHCVCSAKGIEQCYSIILRKGPVTNVKNFRGPVTPIKPCKCYMSWIFLTKKHENLMRLYIDVQNPVNG